MDSNAPAECEHGHRLDRTCVACSRLPTTIGTHSQQRRKEHQLSAQEWELLTEIRSKGVTSDLEGGIRVCGNDAGTTLAQLGLVQFGHLSWVGQRNRDGMRFVRLTRLGKRCMRYQLQEDDPLIIDPTGRPMNAHTDKH